MSQGDHGETLKSQDLLVGEGVSQSAEPSSPQYVEKKMGGGVVGATRPKGTSTSVASNEKQKRGRPPKDKEEDSR